MTSKFRLCVLAGALLAGAVLGNAAVAAAQDASSDDGANTDNGVHAVPSGHVAEAVLSPLGGQPIHARRTVRIARNAHVAQQFKLAAASPPVTGADDQDRDDATGDAVKPSDDLAGDLLENAGEGLVQADAPPEPVELAQDAAPAQPAAPETPTPKPQPLLLADKQPVPLSDKQPVLLADKGTFASPHAADETPQAAPQAPPAATAPVLLADADDTAAGPRVERIANSPEQAPPGAAASGRHVAFPRHAAEAASAFDRYMSVAAAITPGFNDSAGVAAALQAGSGYDPRQLEEGMIAYGAIAALQDPTFVYGVLDASANEDTREALVDELLAYPLAVERLPGAKPAAARAETAILHEAEPVVVAGKALKQAAYAIQHQEWSGAKPADGDDRLARAKAASQARIAAGDADVARLLTRATSPASPGADAAASGISPVAARSLALAALAVMDGAQGEDPDRLAQVVNEAGSTQCLRMAKLNLYQCLSAAGAEYEDVYCLGQHAVLDTGQCVSGAAKPAGSILLSAFPALDRSRAAGFSRAP